MAHRRPHPTFASSVFTEQEGYHFPSAGASSRPIPSPTHTRPCSATYSSSIFKTEQQLPSTSKGSSNHHDVVISSDRDDTYCNSNSERATYNGAYTSMNDNNLNNIYSGSYSSGAYDSKPGISKSTVHEIGFGRKIIQGPHDQISRDWRVQDKDFIPGHKKRIQQPGIDTDYLDEEGRPKLVASDNQGAICHQRKRFPERQYSSNISRLSADEAKAVEMKTARHLKSAGVASSLSMAHSPVRATELNSENVTYSIDPHKAIYSNANSVEHRTRRTIPHGQTPYANSDEFRQLKRENDQYEEGNFEIPSSTPTQNHTNSAGPGRSTFLDHDNTIRDPYEDHRNQKKMIGQMSHTEPPEDCLLAYHTNWMGACPSKVPRKHVPHYEHEPAGRNCYSRQVMGRYESTDNENPVQGPGYQENYSKNSMITESS